MGKQLELSDKAFQMDGKMPLSQAIPLGLQHVLAMFVGNLTPLLIITGACGIAGGDFADLQLALLQNAMLLAGIVTLVQLFGIGPVGGRVPVIMGTSSGFIGVFNSVAASMGGGVLAYGAIMGASIIGGLFEVLGDEPFPGNQLIDADAEFLGEQRKHLHIRQVAAGLPAGNGFIGHAEALAQRLLGQPLFTAQLRQKRAETNKVHRAPPE